MSPALPALPSTLVQRLSLTGIAVGDDSLHATTATGAPLSVHRHRVVTVKKDDVLGHLARAILVMQRDERPLHLIVVEAPRLNAPLVAQVGAFMTTWAPRAQWALLGDNGDAAIHAPVLGFDDVDIQQRRRAAPGMPKRTTAQPFSDLNSWMLKVLLMRDVDERFWSGPRGSVPTVSALAAISGVSEPHAYRFVKTFEVMDFVRRTDRGIVVVRRAALARLWFDAMRLAPRRAVPVRWMQGRPETIAEVFSSSTHAAKGALTSFDACRVLGVLHADVPIHEVRAALPLSGILDELDLEPCDVRDAHFSLLPTADASTLRGGLAYATNLDCVDVLQAALDVVAHPARGLEQAEFIVDDVLGWR